MRAKGGESALPFTPLVPMTYLTNRVRISIGLTGLVAVSLAAVAFWSLQRADAQEETYTLDHFKCYDTRLQNLRSRALVFLLDQFGIHDQTFERDIVAQTRFFCNPTRKIHNETEVGVSHADDHLIWRSLRPVFSDEKFNKRSVVVLNQFVPNGQTLRVIRPSHFAVPTQKVAVDGEQTEHGFPEDLDHYKCYDVKGDDVNAAASVQDQFDVLSDVWNDVAVVTPRYLCNPSYKIHFKGFGEDNRGEWEFVDVKHPNDHLVCYQVREGNRHAKKVIGRNQFGEQEVLTGTFELLCVPSEKRLLEQGQVE